MNIAKFFIKAHTLIAGQHRLAIADLRVAIPHGIGNGSDFIPAFLSAANLSAHGLERLHKESLNEVGLEFVCLHALHIFLDGHDRMNIHHIIGQGIFFNEFLELVPVYGVVYHFIQAGFYLGVVSIPHCLNKQVAEGAIVKCHLAKDVEHLAAKRLTFFLQLLEQALEHEALPCFGCNQIPQMANFRLADTVDTAKPLLQPVRIPRQIIVYHQMRSLQVDTLASGIRCNQHSNTHILLEKLLCLAPFVTEHSAVNRNDSFLVTE